VDIVRLEPSPGVYLYKIMEINSGIMMEKMPSFIENGEQLAKEIYRDAILAMFEKNPAKRPEKRTKPSESLLFLPGPAKPSNTLEKTP